MRDHPTLASGAGSERTDCDRAAHELIAAFPRDLGAAALAALDEHASVCAACSFVVAEAREQQRLLEAWIVPASSSRLTDRIVAAATIDAAERVVCARKRDALESALQDERVDPQVAELRAHVQHCTDCSNEWAHDHASDALLRAWSIPSPPARLVETVLARLRDARPRLRPSWRRTMPTLAAAAVVIAIGAAGAFGVWSQRDFIAPAPLANHESTPSTVAGVAGVAAFDVDAALQRFGGDVHVQNVMNTQCPAGIGSFAPTAVALERVPRQPGALFHRALRRVQRDANASDRAGDDR